MTASTYPDDGVGEVFLKLGKQGSTLAGVMDAFSIAISVGLQYGIPLESYVGQVHQHAVRAGRHHRRPGHPDRELGDGLHLPPPGARPPALRPARRARHPVRRRARRRAGGPGPGHARRGGRPGRACAVVRPENTPFRTARFRPRPADPVSPPTPRAAARGGHGNGGPHSTAELIEFQQGRTADAPLCLTCGTKMRPAGAATSARAAAPPAAAAESERYCIRCNNSASESNRIAAGQQGRRDISPATPGTRTATVAMPNVQLHQCCIQCNVIEGEVPVPQITHRDLVAFAEDRVHPRYTYSWLCPGPARCCWATHGIACLRLGLTGI